jgi:uncharacterized protein involved in propanediol utilization
MQTAAQLQELRRPPPERPRSAPATALFPPAADTWRTGYGEVHAHHGEIVQGMFYAPEGTVEHALVTLPCALFGTRARFRPLRSGPLTVEPADRGRARLAARLTLDALGRTGWGGSLCIEGNVPLRWGCGSSTTDVLSTIRAVADAFSTVLEPAWIARISVAAETASDSLMYGPERAVLFAQRRGSVLLDLGGPLPTVRVLGLNTEVDRGVETLALPPMAYSTWEVEAFRPVLGMLRRAVEHQDPELLGRVATASTVITQRHRPKRFMPELLQLAREVGAEGVQVAHSGTVAGLIFTPDPGATARIERARAALRRLGVDSTWEFSNDLSLQTELAA